MRETASISGHGIQTLFTISSSNNIDPQSNSKSGHTREINNTFFIEKKNQRPSRKFSEQKCIVSISALYQYCSIAVRRSLSNHNFPDARLPIVKPNLLINLKCRNAYLTFNFTVPKF